MSSTYKKSGIKRNSVRGMGCWVVAFACASLCKAASLSEGFITAGGEGVTACTYRYEKAKQMAEPSQGSGLTWGGYTQASQNDWRSDVRISGTNKRLELYSMGSGGDDAAGSANYKGTYTYTIFDTSGDTVPDTSINLARINVTIQAAAAGQTLRWLVRDDAGQWFLSETVSPASTGTHTIPIAGMTWLRIDQPAEDYMNALSAGGTRWKSAIADPATLSSAVPDVSAITGGGFYVESGDTNPSDDEIFMLNEIQWLSDSVELISPLDAANVTDIALSFRWWRQAWATNYNLQVSADPSFSTFAVNKIVQAMLAEDEDDSWGWGKYRHVAHLPEAVLPAGEYYWRVRTHGSVGVPHGPWSETRSITLNDDHSTLPPARPISPANPLFTLHVGASDAEVVENHWSEFWGNIPDDIKPYTYLSMERPRFFDHETFVDCYDRIRESGMNCMVIGQGPIPFQAWESLAELEWAFQNVPNLGGIMAGEAFWVYGNIQWYEENREILRYTERVIQLCAKYGKYYMHCDGNWMVSWRWDRYFAKTETFGSGGWDQYWMDPDFLRAHKKWLVYGPKSNICWASHQMSGATQGAWLAGLFDNLGYWAESWFWRDAGYTDPYAPPLAYDEGDYDLMPPSFWNNMLILGAAQGASVFFIESNTTLWDYNGSPQPTTAIWDRKGVKHPNLDNIIIPFIRALTEHKLIPTKEEVVDELKIAVKPGRNDDPLGYVPEPITYRKYEAMYKGTFGVEDSAATNHCGGELWDIIPQTGRYQFIPILPDPVNTISNAPGLVVLEVAELTEAAEVTAIFDAYYPRRYTGDAWVSLVGDKFFIMNSKENQDVTQSFSIQLPGGSITNLSGTIRPFKHILGRRSNWGNSLVLHANTSITDEPTTLTLDCDSVSAPGLRVEPASALTSSDWNGSELTFTLSHSDYAVDVWVDIPMAPVMTNAMVLSDGSFAFDVMTSSGLSNAVQASANLGSNQWSTLTTVVGTNYFSVVDTNTPFHKQRFYRVLYSVTIDEDPVVIPVEAEGYDRQSGVQTETCDEGGLNVGWIENGDWMEYDNVDIPAAGQYAAEFRVASDASGGSVQIMAGGVEVGHATVSGSGGWQDWTTVTATLNFTASGPQTLRLNCIGDDGYLYNLNWFRIVGQ